VTDFAAVGFGNTVTAPEQADTGKSGRGPLARRRRRLTAFRIVVFVVMGVFFFTPILAMFEFTTRGTGIGAARTLAPWREIFDYPDLITAIQVSLELAAITSVAGLFLLVPTMVWVRLRLPKLQRVIEFLCLLPLTVPAIVLVVGLAPVYAWVSYLFGSSVLTLAFAYVVLVLPYTYRVIDAGLRGIDVQTLSEAARSLGASWPTVMWRIIAPNIRSALLNAALLSVALVLGEFTIASLLSFENLQVAINFLGRANAGVSIAVALGSLIFAFILLVCLSFVGRRRTASVYEEE
jgi:putative spermidine/putrescine transport system permease protein